MDNSAATKFNMLINLIKPFFRLNKPNRPWHVSLVATLSMAVPALTGVYFHNMPAAILACVGTLVILYLPRNNIAERMVTLAVCSVGFIACLTLGMAAGFNLYASVLVLIFTASLADFICRYYLIPAPANFFFIMLTALGCTMPFDLAMIPTRVGLIALGCMLSCLLAFFYSLCVTLPPLAPKPDGATHRRIAVIVLESLIMGLFIGGAFLLAESLGLTKPYWVPISCAAIMQGATFEMVLQRKIHRVVGTALGMGLAWCVFSFSLHGWSLVTTILVLNFIIEILVVRHYGLAVIFITPLTMLFAEGSTSRILHETLVVARMGDIALGSFLGFIGGWAMHHPKLFTWIDKKFSK